MTQAMNTFRAGWGWFRTWRRTRPFWGGLLLLSAGIELLVAPAAQSLILPIDLIIYAGVAGVSGILIGVLLIAIGALSWLQPAQHTFFGVVGLMLALVSFVTSNFGGFVIGMLLGIVGGALVFAWGPDARRRSRGRRRTGAFDAPTEPAETDGHGESGEAEAAETEGVRSSTTSENDADTTLDEPRAGTRPLAVIALPLAVAITIASAPAPTLGWPWDWLFPGDEEEQSEETPVEEPSPSPSEDPEDPPQGSGPDGDSEGDTDEEEPEEDEEDEEDLDEDAAAEDCELRIGDSAVIDEEQDFLDAVLACEVAEEEGTYPEVMVDSDYDCFRGSVRDGGLTADSLTMFGARYEGVVECPTADGPRRYLRLTMSRSDLNGGELWFDDAGVRMTLGLPTMRMDGDVELHVTSMSVRLLGIPLTFTPDFPPPLLLPIMYVTDLDVGDPMASTDKMTIPGLDSQHAGGGS